MTKKVEATNYLDPEFVKELKAAAGYYDKNQELADDDKWNIATLVNEMWPEHKTMTYDGFTTELVYPTKEDFFIACSFQANEGLKKPRFSASGETLRRWCEVQATYATFPNANLLLEALSFDHMRLAKQLAYHEKVASPVLALATAQKEGWTATEMKEHYDPPQVVNIYDKFTGWIDSLWNTKLEFLKSADDRAEARKLIASLRGIIERNK